MTYATKYPDRVKEIPENTKYIVLVNESYSEHDYHSDSCSNRNYINAITFDSEELLKEWVIHQTTKNQWNSPTNPKDIVILPYNRININIETKLSFQ